MFLNTCVTNVKLKLHTVDEHKFHHERSKFSQCGGENMGLVKRMQLTLAGKFTTQQ
jgi:hypothetical protein